MKKFRRGKKQVLASLCCVLKLNRLLLLLKWPQKPSIRIVAYHRVLESSQLIGYPFDDDLIEVTTEEFECQLKYLASNFDVISFADVIDYMDGKTTLPKRPLLITFDDGFRDNYEFAFPIIKAINVPVTMMLATDYIGGTKTFWYDWLAFIVLNVKADELLMDENKVAFSLPESKAERRSVFFQIIEYLKNVAEEERLQLLEELNVAYGTIYDSLPDNIKELSQPMSWENVREMAQAGIEFGSHTVTHPFLSKVSKEQLNVELSDSKRIIERETGKAVSVIAYPNGQREDFNDEVKSVAQELGYKIGLSYINGVNYIDGFDRYEMKRIHVFPHHDFSLFKMTLALPTVF